MPNSFEDEEEQQVFSTEFDEDGGIDTGAAPAEDPNAVAEEFVANLSKESTDTQYLSEVERRLDLAGYYRQLLHPGSIFESSDPGARQVEGELRIFAEGRLQSLLGIRADHQPISMAKPQFSDEEAAALRKFAAISEAELKVLWALLATAARSKTVMGTPPVKAPPAPAKVLPPQQKPAPTIRKIPAVRAPAPQAAPPAPAPAPRAPAPAPKPTPKTRTPATRAEGGPPAPLLMPRGQELEGVLQSTAISQSRQGAKMDEARRRDQGGEVFRG